MALACRLAIFYRGEMRRSVVHGALSGMTAWVAYAAAEHAFFAVVPRVVKPHLSWRMLHHEGSLALLLFYAAAGAAIGAAIGAALHRAARERVRSSALATVTAAFALHLAAQQAARPAPLTLSLLGLAGGITFLLLAVPRVAALARPLPVALLLTGPPWITKDLLANAGAPLRAGAPAAFCAGVLLLSALIARVAARRGRAEPGLRGVAAAAVAVFLAGLLVNRLPSSTGTTAAAGAPHVLLVVLDTVRADHLSLQGYERRTSPRLEDFAREATVFTRAIAAGDMTLSTHASLFTGVYSREHGAHHPDPERSSPGAPAPLAERFDTLAERLQGAGYRTFGVVANHGYLGPFFRLNQGFDYWDSRAAVAWTPAKYFLRSALLGAVDDRRASPDEGHRAFRTADEIDDEVFALLRRLGTSPAPIFLFVNYMDAHFPYVPPPPYDTMFPGRDPSLSVEALDRRRRDVVVRGGTITEAERRHLLSQYDGGIAYVDACFGKLMDCLRSDGRWNDWLVVVTSDHGEAFGERNLMDHGMSVYQDQVFVPLVIKAPAASPAAPGSVVDTPVGSVDVFATILTTVGLAVPPETAGRSLLAPVEPRAVFAEHFPFERLARHDSGYAYAELAIVEDSRKLIRSSRGKRELYDLAEDPGELVNVAGSDSVAAGRLDAELSRWLESTVPAAVDTVSLDDDAAERLRALGYVQ
jgi:arylsulfatase A-like enzyme